jgi:hypothetical protein
MYYTYIHTYVYIHVVFLHGMYVCTWVSFYVYTYVSECVCVSFREHLRTRPSKRGYSKQD